MRGTHRRRRSTGNGNSPAKTGSEQKSFENSPRAKRVLRLHQDELDEVVQQSGLDAETVHEKFSQFCTITEGKPSKVSEGRTNILIVVAENTHLLHIREASSYD